MSKYLQFPAENVVKHTCKGRREGDWLIFECPQCSYVRVWNTSTNEMRVTDFGDENVLHNGRHEPVGLQTDKYNPN